MAIVADQRQHRIAETIDTPQNDRFAQQWDHQEFIEQPATRIQSSHWKAWAIGGAAAVALVAIASIGVSKKSAPSYAQPALTMDLAKPQGFAVSRQSAPTLNQGSSLALRAPAAKNVAGRIGIRRHRYCPQ